MEEQATFMSMNYRRRSTRLAAVVGVGVEVPIPSVTVRQKRKKTERAETPPAEDVKSMRESKKRRVKVKPTITIELEPKESLVAEDVDSAKPKVKLRKRRAEVKPEKDDTHVPDNIDEKPKVKRRKKRVKLDDEDDFDANAEAQPKRKRVKPEPVYEILDVERLETTFRGRLGYACLNTVLRNKKPASESVFCSRTCRIDSLKKNGMDWVKDLGCKNVTDLITMIQWNEDNNIRFMRVSSEMFPFASHEEYGYSLAYCADLLGQAGALANKLGHRLTVHPGQFTQLGSPKAKIIESAVRELEYHCEMLDLMGMGVDSVMIVHGGGMYGDKSATLERIKTTITDVLPPKIRARLVLENDEICYNAEDLLPLCEELDVPFVFDYHHDALFPSSIPPTEIIARADAIWRRRGIRPKQHLSEPRPGAVTLMERRAHADRCTRLPPDLPDDMDLMIEAKDKEQAVFELHRIYGLQPVVHASLRPPDKNQTKETKGRKSTVRARAKAKKELEEGEDAEDAEKMEEVEDAEEVAAEEEETEGPNAEGLEDAPEAKAV